MLPGFTSEQELFPYVMDAMAEALVLLDEKLCIRFINSSAIELLLGAGMTVWDNPIGVYYYDYIGISPESEQYEGATLRSVMDELKSHRGILYTLPSGKSVSINIVPVHSHEKVKGVLLTAQDVTTIVELEQELDLAFGLTLPNSKVEYKMKNTPEFRDEYDSKTGHITITGIIPDGVYRHVVNSLKIFASLKAQGVTNVIGIDKDQLVQAIIFHDLGKAQPDLHVGDVVDPNEVFEDGKLHAFRGAEIAKYHYNQSNDVVDIIRYHHHAENELPDSFASRLIPMFRLFQLIDGLSAAVTRGGVEVSFSVNDCTVYVTEKNRRPQYDGSWKINLYTGERRRI